MLRYLLLSGSTILVVEHGLTAAYGQSAPEVEDVKNAVDQAKVRNRDPFAIAEQKNFGITAGDWIILPEINAGTFYDDNVFSSKTNPKGSWGFDLQPGVTFKRNTGIHNTNVSLTGDLSTPLAVSGADTFVGTADLKHVYQIERGLTLTYQGEVAHRYDQESAFSATGTGGGGTAAYVEPISYMAYASSLVVDKSFSDAFVSAAGNILAFEYNNARTTTGQTIPESDRDLIEYSARVRAGLRFLSDLYVFVEPNITQYDFQQGVPATGYTLSGGVGSDRLSLFRSEIFGGYQIVDFGSGASSTSQLSGGTFGGRVAWAPTRDLVATLEASQAFTPSTVITGSVGSINKSDSVSAKLTYGYTTRITFDARASFSKLEYSVGSRDDKISQIGMSGTYYLTERVGVRLQYDFTDVNSSQAIYDYERNRVILGIHLRL